MFETLSYLALQQYWWIIIAILWSTLVFMMFVQWGQTLFYEISKTEKDKSLIINAFWKHYKLTFSVLITFGWAIFASFPIFYSTSFGWAYLVWMAILFVFIIQAVSYEYRTKMSNFLWQKTYEVFLFINGLLWPLLIWIALATFFTWWNFVIDQTNLVNSFAPHHIITSWTTPFYWLEALWNTRELAFITNISLWLTVVFLIRTLANLYIINHVKDKNINISNIKSLKINTIFLIIFFFIFVFKLFTISGFSYDINNVITIIEYKYLNNILEMPLVFCIFVFWLILYFIGIFLWIIKDYKRSFWISWVWVFFLVFSLFMIVGLNNTSFYPSLSDLQSSLTIENSSSSKYTLTVMSYVSLLLPFVLSYTLWAWKVISPKKMSKSNLKKDFDVY